MAITQKYSGHEHRLEGLLLEWLNRGAATYRQLVRALQSVPVDETELANELQRKYSLKGQLYVAFLCVLIITFI